MSSSANLTWVERNPLLGAVLWTAVPSLVSFAVAHYLSDSDLRKAIYTGAATLLFGGLLGGVLKLILDEIAAMKRRRDDAAMFVSNLLADLKGVYDRTARSQLLISAHKSARTYGDELRGLIDATVQLHNVHRALEGRADGVAEGTVTGVKQQVSLMRAYLDGLTGEFRESYKPIADDQRSYEARADALVKKFGEATDGAAAPSLPSFVWDRIVQLPRLKDFIDNGAAFTSQFDEPLRKATSLLRAELARILSRTQDL